MKLRYERGALADLDEIFAFIARDSREAAARLVGRIEQGDADCRDAAHGRGDPQVAISAISRRQLIDRV